jgi:hypothetical protein
MVELKKWQTGFCIKQGASRTTCPEQETVLNLQHPTQPLIRQIPKTPSPRHKPLLRVFRWVNEMPLGGNYAVDRTTVQNHSE